jgi:hypothetical protein
MRVLHGLVVSVGAAARVSDLVRHSEPVDGPQNVRLGAPEQWIVDAHVLLEDVTEQPLEAFQRLRMRGPRRPSAQHVTHGRQVEADHPVLMEGNRRPAEHRGRDDSEGGE